MAIDLRTAEITGLHLSLIDTEGQIDRALDRGARRAFRVWARRHASLANRLQNKLMQVLTAAGCV